MTHSYVWHDSFICVTWLIHMCDMTHSHVWHDSFIYVTWLIHMCDMTHSHVWHDSFIYDTYTCVHRVCAHEFVSMCTWVREYVHMSSWVCAHENPRDPNYFHVCDTIHSYVWHDSFICVTWLNHICDMTHSYVTHTRTWTHSMCTCGTWEPESSDIFLYVWHDSFICVTWLIFHVWPIHMRDMTHSYMTRTRTRTCTVCVHVARTQEFRTIFICVTWFIHMCDTTHSFVWHDYSHMCHDSCIRHTHTHTHAHTQYVYSWHMRTQKIRLLWALTSSFLHCRYVRTFNVRHDSFNVRHDSFNPRHDLSIFDIDFIPWIYTYAHIQIHFSTYLYIYIYIHVQVCRSIDTSILFCHKVLCMCLCVYFRSINVRCGLSLRFVFWK